MLDINFYFVQRLIAIEQLRNCCKNNTWGSDMLIKKGDAVWKTQSQPFTTVSKAPSSSKFASTSCRRSLAPSKARKWSILAGSPEYIKYAEIWDPRNDSKKAYDINLVEESILLVVRHLPGDQFMD